LMRIRLILYSIPDRHHLDAPLLVSLLILRDQDKELYNKYIETQSIADKVYEFLCQGFLPLPKDYKRSDDNSDTATKIIGFLIATNYSYNDKENQAFNNLIKPYSNTADSGTRNYNDRILHIANSPRGSDYYDEAGESMLKLSVERIELIQQINLPSP